MASRWWVDGGQPTVGLRRQAMEMCHWLAIGSLAVNRWWQFAAYSHWRTDGVVLSGAQCIGALGQALETDQSNDMHELYQMGLI